MDEKQKQLDEAQAYVARIQRDMEATYLAQVDFLFNHYRDLRMLLNTVMEGRATFGHVLNEQQKDFIHALQSSMQVFELLRNKEALQEMGQNFRENLAQKAEQSLCRLS